MALSAKRIDKADKFVLSLARDLRSLLPADAEILSRKEFQNHIQTAFEAAHPKLRRVLLNDDHNKRYVDLLWDRYSNDLKSSNIADSSSSSSSSSKYKFLNAEEINNIDVDHPDWRKKALPFVMSPQFNDIDDLSSVKVLNSSSNVLSWNQKLCLLKPYGQITSKGLINDMETYLKSERRSPGDLITLFSYRWDACKPHKNSESLVYNSLISQMLMEEIRQQHLKPEFDISAFCSKAFHIFFDSFHSQLLFLHHIIKNSSASSSSVVLAIAKRILDLLALNLQHRNQTQKDLSFLFYVLLVKTIHSFDVPSSDKLALQDSIHSKLGVDNLHIPDCLKGLAEHLDISTAEDFCRNEKISCQKLEEFLQKVEGSLDVDVTPKAEVEEKDILDDETLFYIDRIGAKDPSDDEKATDSEGSEESEELDINFDSDAEMESAAESEQSGSSDDELSISTQSQQLPRDHKPKRTIENAAESPEPHKKSKTI